MITYFSFAELFAGIGGLGLPFMQKGGYCVFASESDKYAAKTYEVNHGVKPYGDITKIDVSDIPYHDILLAGFPCQDFSVAGKREGLSGDRGALFFQIPRVLLELQPKMFLLENVKNLIHHNYGATLQIILNELDSVNYYTMHFVFNAKDFGLPQSRNRVYIVGVNKDLYSSKILNNILNDIRPPHTPTRVEDILEAIVDSKYTLSEKGWSGMKMRKEKHIANNKNSGCYVYSSSDSHTGTLTARYCKDGSDILISQPNVSERPRKLTPRECARLQGFTDSFIVDAVSQTQAYKQLGNSVAVPVIHEIASAMLAHM